MTGRTRRDGVAGPRWSSNSAGIRRRPDDRPGRRRDRDADPVAGQQAIAGRPQRRRGPPRRARARAAPGRSCERRWVRLRIPALTCADVPSGATSVSRTTAVATGAETARWRTTSGTPRISSAVVERRGGVGRAERLVGAQVAGRGRSAGRRRPTTGRRASRRSAGGGSGRRRRRPSPRPPSPSRPPTSGSDPPREPPVARARSPGAGRPSPPASDPGSSAGNGSGSAYSRSNQMIAGSASAPFVGCPSASGRRTARSHGARRGSGPGVADDGRPWTQLPTIVRDRGGAARPASAAPASTYESIQPPMLRIAASIAS